MTMCRLNHSLTSKAFNHMETTYEKTAAQTQPKIVKQHTRDLTWEATLTHDVTDCVCELHAKQRKCGTHDVDTRNGSQFWY